jgi:hypothetical protein
MRPSFPHETAASAPCRSSNSSNLAATASMAAVDRFESSIS